MKRRIATISVFLLVGAIVNVAVAWGCAMWIRFDASSHFDAETGGVLEVEHGYQHWLVSKRCRQGACEISSQWADSDRRFMFSGYWPNNRPEHLIPRWAWFARPPVSGDSQGRWHYRWVDGWGWPMLAMWSACWCETATHATTEPVHVLYGIRIDKPTLGLMRSNSNSKRVVPLFPILPGFIINAAFYAALIWLLFFAPFRIRRALRRKRRLCEKCAYPIGVSPVCTECGAAVVRRSKT